MEPTAPSPFCLPEILSPVVSTLSLLIDPYPKFIKCDCGGTSKTDPLTTASWVLPKMEGVLNLPLDQVSIPFHKPL